MDGSSAAAESGMHCAAAFTARAWRAGAARNMECPLMDGSRPRAMCVIYVVECHASASFGGAAAVLPRYPHEVCALSCVPWRYASYYSYSYRCGANCENSPVGTSVMGHSGPSLQAAQGGTLLFHRQ